MGRCTKCNHIQVDDLQFCTLCGTEIIPPSENRCKACGGGNPEEVNFCIHCGAPIDFPIENNKIHEKADPAYQKIPPRPQRVKSIPYTPPSKKKIKRKTILIIASIITLVVFSTVAVTWSINAFLKGGSREDLLTIGEIKEEKAQLNPAPMPLSGTKSFEVSPTNGVTISGEENVLDKERRFKAHKLKDKALKKLVEDFPYGQRVVLDAYEVHAGLKEDEYFPGNIKVAFDLDKMDIPEEMRPYLSLVRIGEDGKYEVLPTTVEGTNLVGLTNKNSVLSITLLLSALAAASGYLIYDDLGEKYLWKFPEYKDTKWYQTTEITHYSIYWPEEMEPYNPQVVKAMADRFNKIFTKYKIPTDRGIAEGIIGKLKNENYKEYRQAVRRILGKIFYDEEFIKAFEEASSIEWQRENLWPTEVRVTIDALEEADKYLFDKRKFKRPGHVIDVGILPKWPYQKKLIWGYTHNPKLASPYIHVNASSGNFPWLKKHLEEEKYKDVFQSGIDELHVTMVHELFHVVQNGYVPVDWNSYMWFWESTAVTLENEAISYYLDEEIIKTKNASTERDKYETFTNTLSYSNAWTRMKGDQLLIRNQGYTSSIFLESLRDRYYAHDKDDFLKKVLIRFSYRKDGIQSLREQTSNDEMVFESDYRIFARKNAEIFHHRMFSVLNDSKAKFHPLMDGKKYTLTEKKPVAEIKVEYNPLSTTMQYLDILYDTKKYKEKDARLVLERGEDDLLKTSNVHISLDQGNGKDFKFRGNGHYYIRKNLKNTPVAIQEIHAYHKVQGENKEKSYRAYMMLKPPEPKLEIKDNKLIVTLPEKGPLFKEGFAKKYLIRIYGPNNNSIMLETDKKTEEIKLSTAGDFIDWENPKFKEKVGKAAKDYIEANPDLKEKLIKDMGKEAVDKGVNSIKDLNIDYGVLNKAAEILNEAMTGEKGEKEYRVVVCEKAGDKTPIYGPPSDWSILKVENKSTGDVNIYGTWEGKVQITGEKVTITISQGKKGYDYTLTNSMYEDEINGGLMEFYGRDNKDGTVTFGEDQGFGFTLIKNSEKELYVTAPPMTLRRK